MPRPQIRHLTLFADDTEKVAQFYVDVFEMDIVDSNKEIHERIIAGGCSALRQRPADRFSAEQHALDPEGNMFDISEHGYERAETGQDRSAASAEPLAAGTK